MVSDRCLDSSTRRFRCQHIRQYRRHFRYWYRNRNNSTEKYRVQHFQGLRGTAWQKNTEAVGRSSITELYKAISATILWMNETKTYFKGLFCLILATVEDCFRSHLKTHLQ